MSTGQEAIKQDRKAAKKTLKQREKLERLADMHEERGNLRKFGYVAISIVWIILLATSLPIVVFLVLGIPFVIVSWLKGHRALAIFGAILTPLAVIGSLQLAKPFSWWFDRFYAPRDAATASHFFSKNSGSSARRSLSRNLGELDDADVDAAIDLYMLDRPADYCVSELELGRGTPDVPLPQHYKELFAFMNIFADHIPDSARPETFREYFLIGTEGEMDIFVDEEFVEAAQIGARSTGGQVEPPEAEENPSPEEAQPEPEADKSGEAGTKTVEQWTKQSTNKETR